MAALVKKIVMASSMAAVSAAIAIAALYFFATGVETQRQSILSGDGVIVIRTMHSYLPGVFIGAIGVLLFALALLTFLRSEEHTSELQSRGHLVCLLLLEKNKKDIKFCFDKD